MAKTEVQTYKELLERKRGELLESIRRAKKGLTIEQIAELLESEQAAASRNQFVIAMESDSRLLRAVDAALAQIRDNNSFGLCQKCGNAIPEIRLKLVPWTTQCTTCKEYGQQRSTQEGETRNTTTYPSQPKHRPNNGTKLTGTEDYGGRVHTIFVPAPQPVSDCAIPARPPQRRRS